MRNTFDDPKMTQAELTSYEIDRGVASASMLMNDDSGVTLRAGALAGYDARITSANMLMNCDSGVALKTLTGYSADTWTSMLMNCDSGITLKTGTPTGHYAAATSTSMLTHHDGSIGIKTGMLAGYDAGTTLASMLKNDGSIAFTTGMLAGYDTGATLAGMLKNDGSIAITTGMLAGYDTGATFAGMLKDDGSIAFTTGMLAGYDTGTTLAGMLKNDGSIAIKTGMPAGYDTGTTLGMLMNYDSGVTLRTGTMAGYGPAITNASVMMNCDGGIDILGTKVLTGYSADLSNTPAVKLSNRGGVFTGTGTGTLAGFHVGVEKTASVLSSQGLVFAGTGTGLLPDYSVRVGTTASILSSRGAVFAGTETGLVPKYSVRVGAAASQGLVFAGTETGLLPDGIRFGAAASILSSDCGVFAGTETIRVVPPSPLDEFAADGSLWSRGTAGDILGLLNRGANDETLSDYIVSRLGLDMKTLKAIQRSIEALFEYKPEQILDLLRRVESILRLQIDTAGMHTARPAVDEIGRGPDIHNVVSSLAQHESHEAEFAHVLFMDIVAYSKHTTREQIQIRQELKKVVRGTPEFGRVKGNSGDLIPRSTGDGIALVFFRSPEVAVRCAVQLGQALKNIPDLKLRMGVHSGSVIRDTDINDQLDVAGGGINGAQRVMDCGDAGHILVSKIVAEFLKETGGWEQHLRDLGETTVKHGEKFHLYNIVTSEAGNRGTPKHYLLGRNKPVN